jgi:GntP family gluconate:H+ symporter
MTSAYYLFFILLGSIWFIIWVTAYKKLNAFFALLLAALGVGLLSAMPLSDIVAVLKSGFGNTMGKIGLLIILGTSLGIVLERTGATLSMANAILKFVRERNAPAAVALTGFIIGLPIFCDSGFIILSGLNHSLVQKTHFKMPVMASILATSLYAVHCLVPPHPGISAATVTMGGDLGIVMLWGIVLAVPAALAGYLWSITKGSRIAYEPAESEPIVSSGSYLPSAVLSFVPVIIPIALIALKSILSLFKAAEMKEAGSLWLLMDFVGDPVAALGIGLVISVLLIRKESRPDLSHWLSDGVEKAGVILAIIAAGGMFGEMLQATGVSKNLGEILSSLSLGIFLPFLITAVIKTAQGSSTVAIITASSLVMPLLPDLGLAGPRELTLTILSMGAGSMMVSHANDSYFWVISRFSNLDTATTLKVFTAATAWMSIVVQIIIWMIMLFL